MSDVVLGEAGLTVVLDGSAQYFNYYWLRDADPSCIDPQTCERVFDVTALACPPMPKRVHVEADHLVIAWRNEAHVSRLPLETLRHVSIHGRLADPADLPRRLWYADHYPAITRLTQSGIETDPAIRAQFARSLIEEGVAIVREMEDSDDGLTRLVETLGPVTPTVDGHYFDVRLEIAPSNLAFTASALEMHTDLPNEEAAPGVQFLHCRRNSVEGGSSLFVDGAAAAEAFRASNPEDFALLAHHQIPFFRRQPGWDYRAHQRVIECDVNGAVSGVTVSQHLMDVPDLPQTLLDRYYPAFCQFLKLLQDPRFLCRFRLNAGECIVFDNHRVVHGREAFSADSGARHLRGCYTDRGALRSTYRILAAHGHAGHLAPTDRAIAS